MVLLSAAVHVLSAQHEKVGRAAIGESQVEF